MFFYYIDGCIKKYYFLNGSKYEVRIITFHNETKKINKLKDMGIFEENIIVNHIGLRGQVKWRVSPHFVH